MDADFSHRPADLITEMGGTHYDSAAECPIWEAFLLRIFADNVDLVRFVQRAVGYSMLGERPEQVMFICHGYGRNGKSTFINVIRRMMGSYARGTRIETIAARDGAAVSSAEGRLNGTALFSLDFEGADVYIVADAGGRLHLVGAGASGLEPIPLTTIDHTRSVGELRFDGAKAEPLADDGGTTTARLRDAGVERGAIVAWLGHNSLEMLAALAAFYPWELGVKADVAGGPHQVVLELGHDKQRVARNARHR